jgi:3-oxoacyl-[acyl-carrier protein] reductase
VLPGFHLTDLGRASSKEYRERAVAESVLGTSTDVGELAEFVVFLSRTKTVSGQVFNWDSRII